jgi:hypothetical protein
MPKKASSALAERKERKKNYLVYVGESFKEIFALTCVIVILVICLKFPKWF